MIIPFSENSNRDLCLLVLLTHKILVSSFLILDSPDDCVGMAVDLWSTVTVERAEKFEIIAEGEGAKQMPKDETNYMVIGVKAAFDAANKPMPVLKYHVNCKIPYARGLGSSSAAIVAGIIAGLVLAGHRLPCWGSEALLQIAAGIEVGFFISCVVCSTFLSRHSLLVFVASYDRDTPTTLLLPFTVGFKSALTTEHDGSLNVPPFPPDCSSSCSFLTLKERPLLRGES